MTDATDKREEPVAGSAPRGVMAGLVGTAVSVPAVAIGFVVAEFLKRMLLSKLLHYDVEYSEMHEGHHAFFASVIVAFMTGLIGAGAAATIALKLVRDAGRKAFFTILGIGLAAVLAGFSVWMKTRLHIGTGTLVFSVLLAFAGALLGMYAAVAVEDDDGDTKPEPEADAAAPEAG